MLTIAGSIINYILLQSVSLINANLYIYLVQETHCDLVDQEIFEFLSRSHSFSLSVNTLRSFVEALLSLPRPPLILIQVDMGTTSGIHHTCIHASNPDSTLLQKLDALGETTTDTTTGEEMRRAFSFSVSCWRASFAVRSLDRSVAHIDCVCNEC